MVSTIKEEVSEITNRLCFVRQSPYNNITDGFVYWFISLLGLIGSLQMTMCNKSTANTKETD